MGLADRDLPRVVVRETSDELEISMTPLRSDWRTIFLPLWLVFWIVVGIAAILMTLGEYDPNVGRGFIVLWLVAWAAGASGVGYLLLWTYFGREFVVLRSETIEVRHELFGHVRAHTYDLAQVRDLRVTIDGTWQDRALAAVRWRQGGGLLAFVHRRDTIRFGAGLTEAEARDVLARLESRHTFPEKR